MADNGRRRIATQETGTPCWINTAWQSYSGALHHMNESNTTTWNRRKAFPYYERKKPEARGNALGLVSIYIQLRRRKIDFHEHQVKCYPIPKKVQSILGF